MAYRYDTQWTPNYSTRQSYGYDSIPDGFTIHWWGRMGQQHENVADYLCREGGNSSAHEVISDGQVTHLLDFEYASWHAGSSEGNGTRIGLECRPEMTAGDLETLAQRCADIENQLGKSLVYDGHRDWTATTCPGSYYDQISWLVNRVNEIHAGAKPETSEVDIMPMVPISTPNGKGWHAVGVPAKNRSSSRVVAGVWLSFSPLVARANEVKLAIYDEYANWMAPETGNSELSYVEVNDTVYWKFPSGATTARLEWVGANDDLITNAYLEVLGK